MKKMFFLSIIFFLYGALLQAQWFQQNSGVGTNLYSIFSSDGTTAWMTGANGVILKTTNSGAIWTQKPSGTSYSISFVHFFNQNEGIVAGSGGTIKKSYDGGETWQSISIGTNIRLQEGCFVNDSIGYLIGDAGLLLKTTDKGNNWTSSFIAPENFSYIFFVNDSTGFATTEYTGQIWKTSDKGNNWCLKQIIGNYSIWQVHFVDELNGWVVGEYGTIAHSSDGGESWALQYSGTGVNLRSVYFFTPSDGWVIGKDEKRLKTTDGGNTWLHDHTGYSYEYLHIYFVDDNIGWICGTGGSILYTVNGGIPVELTSFSGSINGNDVILNWSTASELNNRGFEIERRYKNSDWQNIGFLSGHGTTTEIQVYTFIDQPVEKERYFYRLKQFDYDGSFEYSEVVEVVVGISTKFSLAQNYPNPFNPTTSIKFSIPKSVILSEAKNLVTLKVFDVLGNEIATLVNEEKPEGDYEVEWNASDFPSGIYFYKLQAGSFIEIKKMILLK